MMSCRKPITRLGIICFWQCFVLGSLTYSSAQDSSPNSTPTPVSPKTLIISNIEINEQYVDFRRLDDNFYRKNLEYGDKLYASFDSVSARDNIPINLRLPYFLNDLSFNFSAVDWDAPHKIMYSYQLEGVDEDWSVPQEEAKVSYWNLKHGQYVFHVKANGESGIWSDPVTYSFRINRPWWLSIWAYLVYMAIVGSVMYFAYTYWKERKRQEAEIQQLLEAYKLTDFPKAFAMKEAPHESSFLNLVQTTLETHLSDENFGIAELCELLNISRTQLHRKLKKLTGLSTSHYIRSLRLEIAKTLLETSQLNVSEVSFKVGFSSPTYFSKVFKAQYGQAPSDLRKSW